MSRLETLGFKSPSRTHILGGLFYFSYFFLLNYLLMSRNANVLFEFPYVLLLVVPYFFLITTSPLMGLGVYIIYFATGLKTLAPSYGGHITLSTLLDLGLLVALVVHVVRYRTISALKNSLSRLVFLYIGLYVVSALIRKNLYEGGNISIKTAALILLLYVCIVLFLNSQERTLQILRILIFLGLAWSGLSIYHVLRFGVESLYTRTSSEVGYLENIIDVNSLAVSVLMILPLLYFQITLKQRRGWQLLAMVGVALSIITVILTFSRNGFINLILVLALIFLKDKRSRRVWAFVGVLLIAILLTPQRYWTRVLSTSGVETYKFSMSKGISAKLSYVQGGVDIVRRHPLVGIGTGRLERSIHNSIIQVAVEMGLPVMILYLAILAVAFKELKRIRVHSGLGSGGSPSELPYMLMVGLVAYIIGGLTISIHWHFPFFMILGIIAANRAILEKTPIGN